MNLNTNAQRRTDRRTLLQQGLACTLVPPALNLLGAEVSGGAGVKDRTLVLVHLSGGNDGLNSIIPHADPLYHRLRPRLGSVARQAIKIDGHTGFHAALAPLARIFDQGHLAVIQGVGHASPDYSHLGACRACADDDSVEGTGRLDPILAGTGFPTKVPAVGGAPLAAMLRPGLVQVVEGAARPASNPLDFAPGAAQRTLAAAAHIASQPEPPRVVLATVGGFDTHSDQLAAHARALAELSNGLACFRDELVRRGREEQVLLIAWSEFGRRPAENAAGGTDHGWAGPVFVMGRAVKGGLYGSMPSLEHTAFGNLIPAVDFGSVFQLGARWLGHDVAPFESSAGPTVLI